VKCKEKNRTEYPGTVEQYGTYNIWMTESRERRKEKKTFEELMARNSAK
jgi:hypothetical protein